MNKNKYIKKIWPRILVILILIEIIISLYIKNEFYHYLDEKSFNNIFQNKNQIIIFEKK